MAWKPGPSSPRPRGDEIHLWRARQDRPPRPHDELARHLSPEEQARAARFAFARLTEQFIVAHAFVRDVLGAYLGVAPVEVPIEIDAQGKPHLRGSDLRFNLSHSANLAVLAVGTRELGVDVEQIRGDVLRERIAERFFSALEVQALNALPAEHQAAGFFSCWTRKEAYLKALGTGLRIALDRFDVSLGPDEPARLIADRGNDDLQAWKLAAFTPDRAFRGAVVARGHDWSLRGFDWSGPL